MTQQELHDLMVAEFGDDVDNQIVPDLLMAEWTVVMCHSLFNPSGDWSDYNADKRKYQYLLDSDHSVKWLLPDSPPDPADYVS